MRKLSLGLILPVFLLYAVLLGTAPAEAAEYIVQKGDSLYRIGKQFHIPYRKIMKANGLRKTVIYKGTKLKIPERVSAANPLPVKKIKAVSKIVVEKSATRRELETLARIIHAEARGETFEGQVAVGAVIVNRLEAPGFPKTIKGIVFQNTGGVYQFSPVADGSINLKPGKKAYAAAQQALAGVDPSGGALYFYNPKTATDRWIKKLPVHKRIGNHVFAVK